MALSNGEMAAIAKMVVDQLMQASRTHSSKTHDKKADERRRNGEASQDYRNKNRNARDDARRAAQNKAFQIEQKKLVQSHASSLAELKHTINAARISNRDNKENFHDIFGQAAQSASVFFSKAIENTRMDTETVISSYTKTIENSGSAFLKRTANSVKSIEDVLTVSMSVGNAKKALDALEKFGAGKYTLEQMYDRMEALGFTTEQINPILGDLTDNIDDMSGKLIMNSQNQQRAAQITSQFREELVEAQETIADFAKSTETLSHKATNMFNEMEKQWGEFKNSRRGAATIAANKGLLSAAENMSKFGNSLGDLAEATRFLAIGVSFSELSEMHSTYRQSILALGQGFDSFDDAIRLNTTGLLSHVATLKDAVRFNADSISLSRKLGSSQIDTIGFLEEQQQRFARLNGTLGMTAEQFTAMNEMLIKDSDLRGVMFRLGERERLQHFRGMQQNIEMFRAQGLLQEQAEALALTMDKMANKGAKDRLQEGAKLRAVLGGIGLGDMGAQIQSIMMKGSRATPEEQARLANMLAEANRVVGQRMGQSFASEISMDSLIAASGLESYLGPNSSFVNATLAEGGRAATGQVQLLDEMKKNTIHGDEIRKGIGLISNAWSTGLGAFASMLTLRMVANALLAKIAWNTGNGGLVKNIGRLLGGRGGIGTGGINGKIKPGASTLASGAAARAAFTEQTRNAKTTGGVIGKVIAKGPLGKASTMIAKRIPGIGTAIGLTQSAKLWASQDKVGAALTAFGALAAMVPIVGTAIGMATDAVQTSRAIAADKQPESISDTLTAREQKMEERRQKRLQEEKAEREKEIAELKAQHDELVKAIKESTAVGRMTEAQVRRANVINDRIAELNHEQTEIAKDTKIQNGRSNRGGAVIVSLPDPT